MHIMLDSNAITLREAKKDAIRHAKFCLIVEDYLCNHAEFRDLSYRSLHVQLDNMLKNKSLFCLQNGLEHIYSIHVLAEVSTVDEFETLW